MNNHIKFIICGFVVLLLMISITLTFNHHSIKGDIEELNTKLDKIIQLNERGR